jgi:hypothetical protein
MKELKNFRKFLLKEESSQVSEVNEDGLITFEQVKQACINNYSEYLENVIDDEGEGDYGDELNKIDSATNIDELVSILDGMGFNGDEAYDFIFESILK